MTADAGPGTPRFSVLLPTHDRADVVGFAISSVLEQTVPDFELLVVGDGCTDDTARVVASFGDPRVRWFDLPKGPGFGYANRDHALAEARGDLVAFMAHDDLMLPDHLEAMGPVFEDPHVEWAYSRPAWVADDGIVIPFPVDLRSPGPFQRFMTSENPIPASCVVHRRSCFDDAGGWDGPVPRAGD
jgi:glycosyltransferase involved in cell wall biosynthesis